MHVLSAGGFIMKSQWDTYEIFPYNPNAFWTNQNAFIPGQEYNMRCHQKKQLEQEIHLFLHFWSTHNYFDIKLSTLWKCN